MESSASIGRVRSCFQEITQTQLKNLGFAVAIIAAIGGLAVGVAGLAGYLGAINGLSQLQAIGMMEAGGGAVFISTLVAVVLKNSQPFSNQDLDSLDDWANKATEGEDRTEAKRRILECDGRKLNLSELNLKDIPKEIGKLTKLFYLDLDGNQLSSLPESMGRLTNLYRLNLSQNQFTELPKSIVELTRLSELYLRDNLLTALPDEIFQLRGCSIFLDGNPGETETLDGLAKRAGDMEPPRLIFDI